MSDNKHLQTIDYILSDTREDQKRASHGSNLNANYNSILDNILNEETPRAPSRDPRDPKPVQKPPQNLKTTQESSEARNAQITLSRGYPPSSRRSRIRTGSETDSEDDRRAQCIISISNLNSNKSTKLYSEPTEIIQNSLIVENLVIKSFNNGLRSHPKVERREDTFSLGTFNSSFNRQMRTLSFASKDKTGTVEGLSLLQAQTLPEDHQSKAVVDPKNNPDMIYGETTERSLEEHRLLCEYKLFKNSQKKITAKLNTRYKRSFSLASISGDYDRNSSSGMFNSSKSSGRLYSQNSEILIQMGSADDNVELLNHSRKREPEQIIGNLSSEISPINSTDIAPVLDRNPLSSKITLMDFENTAQKPPNHCHVDLLYTESERKIEKSYELKLHAMSSIDPSAGTCSAHLTNTLDNQTSSYVRHKTSTESSTQGCSVNDDSYSNGSGLGVVVELAGARRMPQSGSGVTQSDEDFVRLGAGRGLGSGKEEASEYEGSRSVNNLTICTQSLEEFNTFRDFQDCSKSSTERLGRGGEGCSEGLVFDLDRENSGIMGTSRFSSRVIEFIKDEPVEAILGVEGCERGVRERDVVSGGGFKGQICRKVDLFSGRSQTPREADFQIVGASTIESKDLVFEFDDPDDTKRSLTAKKGSILKNLIEQKKEVFKQNVSKNGFIYLNLKALI